MSILCSGCHDCLKRNTGSFVQRVLAALVKPKYLLRAYVVEPAASINVLSSFTRGSPAQIHIQSCEVLVLLAEAEVISA
jgi:hypothetical protein